MVFRVLVVGPSYFREYPQLRVWRNQRGHRNRSRLSCNQRLHNFTEGEQMNDDVEEPTPEPTPELIDALARKIVDLGSIDRAARALDIDEDLLDAWRETGSVIG